MSQEKPRSGVPRLLHALRFDRVRYRQFIGIAFIVLVSVLGRSTELFLAIGAALVVLGVIVRLWASGHIMKNKVLATGGPYAYVRHPLYVGNILLGVGFCVASGLWWSLPLFLAIMLIFYPSTIRHEDEKLHRTFKQDWEEWRGRTRALIPRLTPYPKASSGGWSFAQSMRKNGEPLIAIFLLACLYLLWRTIK
jgi:protein-S-isoprenylcysteine O-methyltransferase Ste14